MPNRASRTMYGLRADPGPWNRTKRGQGIMDRFDDEDGNLMPLKAGEMPLHHTNLVHSSRGNGSDNRRIGLSISYIPTRVRQTGSPITSALLFRGEDKFGHFIAEARLQREASPEAQTAHAQTCALFRARQDQGADLAETA